MLDFAATGIANELGADLKPVTPCDAPNRPQKYVKFAHGTSPESADSINQFGVDYDAILSFGRGSHSPGAFFTFLLDPTPPLALNLAYEFGLRNTPYPTRPVVMVGKLPESVFKNLERTGAVYTSPLTGSPLPETIFLPQSFKAINAYNLRQWEILRP